MAHGITVRGDGRAEAFYAGKPAWHGLGAVVPELVRSEETLTLAGLGWRVVQKPLFYGLDGGKAVAAVPDKVANLRSDNGGYIGTVGRDYTPLNNVDAFNMLDGIVGPGQAVYETAGSLFGGRRVFVTLKLPEPLNIHGDEVQRYLVLANGHDGSMALRCFWTPVRVVCSNTLNISLGNNDTARRVYFRHTSGIDKRVEEARRMLGLADAYYRNLGNVFKALAEKPLLKDTAQLVINKVLPLDLEAKDRTKDRVTAERELVSTNFEKPESVAANGTAWGLYNAFTRFTSHQLTYRGKSGEDSKRFTSILAGRAQDIQQRAFATIADAVGMPVGADA